MIFEEEGHHQTLPNGNKYREIESPFGRTKFYRVDEPNGNHYYLNEDPSTAAGKTLETLPTSKIEQTGAEVLKLKNYEGKEYYRVTETNGDVWYDSQDPTKEEANVFDSRTTGDGRKVDFLSAPSGDVFYHAQDHHGGYKYYYDEDLEEEIPVYTLEGQGKKVMPVSTEEFGIMYRVMQDDGKVYYTKINPKLEG